MANRNYSNYSKRESEISNVENAMVENAEPEEIIEEESIINKDPDPATIVKGIVKDCYQLNVRETPSPDSNILCEIPVRTKLTIIRPENTDAWFEVELEDGTHGYVMSKYIDANLPTIS